MFLTDALDTYLLDCEARRLASETLRHYRAILTQAVTWLQGQGVQTLDDIEANHLRRWLVWQQERGLGAGSQFTAARMLRTWLYFLEREDLLPGKNPMRKVRMPQKEHKLLPAVPLDDVRRLLEACEDSRDPLRDRAIILLLVDTGIRASELCGLTVGDLVGGRLMIHHGKGGKERAVFVEPVALGALQEYLTTRPAARARTPLFVLAQPAGADERALTYDALHDLFRRLEARAGVKWHPHALRRTFAVESLRNGCDLVNLQKMMGHANLTMLQKHYLPLVEDDQQNAHRRSSPGERLGP